MASDDKDLFPPNSRVHIVGIGGIGTSALAQWLQARGVIVEGSDAASSAITQWLTGHGIPVTTGPVSDFTTLPDTLIYSDAVPVTHPLRVQAQEHSLHHLSYAHALGFLSQQYTTMAISGSHGKSTTTSLVGLLLEKLGLDPMVVVGAQVPSWKSHGLGNFRPGKSNLLVVEADEYNNHFHELTPTCAVITSIDHDHVDAFPTDQDYRQAFVTFMNRIVPGGTVILEQRVFETMKNDIPSSVKTVVTYGWHDGDTPLTYSASRPVLGPDGQQHFTLYINGKPLQSCRMLFPGEHMVNNALAALAVAVSRLGDIQEVLSPFQELISSFTGIGRRFELLGTVHDISVFSDYAHHPTELAALIQASHQRYPDHALLLIFQPHHHQRAAAFEKEFIAVMRDTMASGDRVMLLPVYGVVGREDGAVKIDTQDWVAKIGTHAQFVDTVEVALASVVPIESHQTIIICAGAGDIDSKARAYVTSPG